MELLSLGVRQGNRQGWWKRSTFRCWAAAHPGQDRRLPSVVTHSRAWQASAWPGVGTWLRGRYRLVTGRSCSSATKAKRRLNVQSGLRKGQVYGKTLPGSSVADRDRGCWTGTCGKRMGRVGEDSAAGRQSNLRSGCGMERWSPLGALGL